MFNEWTDFLLLPLAAIVIFLFWASLTPFETLGWWAGWFGNAIYHDTTTPDSSEGRITEGQRTNLQVADEVRQTSAATAYILFLSGIGRVSGQTLSYREQGFIDRLRSRLPGAVVVDNVFPYSVNNLALTGQPIFASMWQWALRRKLEGPALAGYLINMRNMLQVAIAADKRYGPIYNQAMAEVLLDTAMRYGFEPESRVPVFLIGYSGAGQMAIGAVTYLREWIKAPIYVISLGGIFSSDPGILMADRVYHLWGSNDKAQIWRFLMPGRWRWMATSEWNRALRQGRVTIIRLEGMGHTGHGGYLDRNPPEGGGVSNIDKTVEVVSGLVEQAIAASAAIAND